MGFWAFGFLGVRGLVFRRVGGFRRLGFGILWGLRFGILRFRV